MKTKNALLPAMAALSLGIGTPALAHPKLMSSTPAADSSVSAPASVSLTFNERLIAQVSGVDLVMTAMPGMGRHAPMKISGVTTVLSDGGKTMVASFTRVLSAGIYRIDWHAVSVDTHRVTGTLGFTVR